MFHKVELPVLYSKNFGTARNLPVLKKISQATYCFMLRFENHLYFGLFL